MTVQACVVRTKLQLRLIIDFKLSIICNDRKNFSLLADCKTILATSSGMSNRTGKLVALLVYTEHIPADVNDLELGNPTLEYVLLLVPNRTGNRICLSFAAVIVQPSSRAFHSVSTSVSPGCHVTITCRSTCSWHKNLTTQDDNLCAPNGSSFQYIA